MHFMIKNFSFNKTYWHFFFLSNFKARVICKTHFTTAKEEADKKIKTILEKALHYPLPQRD